MLLILLACAAPEDTADPADTADTADTSDTGERTPVRALVATWVTEDYITYTDLLPVTLDEGEVGDAVYRWLGASDLLLDGDELVQVGETEVQRFTIGDWSGPTVSFPIPQFPAAAAICGAGVATVTGVTSRAYTRDGDLLAEWTLDPDAGDCTVVSLAAGVDHAYAGVTCWHGDSGAGAVLDVPCTGEEPTILAETEGGAAVFADRDDPEAVWVGVDGPEDDDQALYRLADGVLTGPLTPAGPPISALESDGAGGAFLAITDAQPQGLHFSAFGRCLAADGTYADSSLVYGWVYGGWHRGDAAWMLAAPFGGTNTVYGLDPSTCAVTVEVPTTLQYIAAAVVY